MSRNIESLYEYAKSAFVNGNLEWQIYPGKHIFSQEMRSRLIVYYRVSGVKVHDARLVTAMCVHTMTDIVTFNTDDFTRYTEITAHHPTTITS